MLTATIRFNLIPLPDNDIWFANSAAWSNYWNSAAATATLTPATTSLYVPVAFDVTLLPARINIDGADFDLTTAAQLTSLRAQLNALDTAFQTMRTDLRNEGYITNAQ